jgi:hypothetical protein
MVEMSTYSLSDSVVEFRFKSPTAILRLEIGTGAMLQVC